MNSKASNCSTASTIQLGIRVPRLIQKQFYAKCEKRGTTGSEMIRTLMERFIHLAEQQNE